MMELIIDTKQCLNNWNKYRNDLVPSKILVNMNWHSLKTITLKTTKRKGLKHYFLRCQKQ